MNVKLLGNDYDEAYFLDNLKGDSIVYSFGVGEDNTFERQLIELTGCKVFAFDPTPRAVKFVTENPVKNFEFYAFGLAVIAGTREFYYHINPKFVSMSLVQNSGCGGVQAVFKTLEDIMLRLNHTHVDFIKMNIEGEEHNIVQHWIDNNITPPADQMWIAVHPERTDVSLKESIEQFNKIKGFKVIDSLYKGVLLTRKE